MAAAKIAGKSTGRAKSAAGASAAPKALPADLPRDPGAHVAKLRGQGQDDSQIRKALQDMGYPAATAKNVAPGSARTASAAAPATGAPQFDQPDPNEDSPAATSDAPSPQAIPARSLPTPDSGGGIAGVVMGLLGTALLINFMRGGPAQVRQWMAAKFLNKVVGGPGQPKYTSPDGGSQFDPPSGAGSSGVAFRLPGSSGVGSLLPGQRV